jgi:hypothetical protein
MFGFHYEDNNEKVESTARQKATKYADTMCSLYVRKLDPICCCCGSTQRLQCGHIFPRGNLILRWDKRNVVTQCASCNAYHEKNPKRLENVIRVRFGEEYLEALRYESHKTVDISTEQISTYGDEFKKQMEEL